MRVWELACGDVCQNLTVEGTKGWATVIANQPHPIYPSMRLVIWHLAWEKGEHRWSLDALHPLMEIDHQSPYVGMTIQQRQDNLRRIFKPTGEKNG